MGSPITPCSRLGSVSPLRSLNKTACSYPGKGPAPLCGRHGSHRTTSRGRSERAAALAGTSPNWSG